MNCEEIDIEEIEEDEILYKYDCESYIYKSFCESFERFCESKKINSCI